MKLPIAIAALTMIGMASVAHAQSNTDRPGSPLPSPSSSAMSQQNEPKDTVRPLRSQLLAVQPGAAPPSAAAAPPPTTAFDKK